MTTVFKGSRLTTNAISKGLSDRGLMPPDCKLIEISITPMSALVIRYEKFVSSDELGLFADAIKEAATMAMAADERVLQSKSADGDPSYDEEKTT